jgi:hypothetical protein
MGLLKPTQAIHCENSRYILGIPSRNSSGIHREFIAVG